MTHCHNCGKKNKDETKFCANCGTRLKTVTEKEHTIGKENEIEDNNPKKNNWLLVGIIILLLVLIWALLMTRSEKTSTKTADNLYCGDNRCNNGETCSSCQNDCGVCPAAEPEVQKEFDFDVWFGQAETSIDSFPDSPSNYQTFTINKLGVHQINGYDYYYGPLMYVYTESKQLVTCYVKEYYGGTFLSDEFTVKTTPLGGVMTKRRGGAMGLAYKVKDSPKDVKYVLDCKGEYGYDVIKTYRLKIEYV